MRAAVFKICSVVAFLVAVDVARAVDVVSLAADDPIRAWAPGLLFSETGVQAGNQTRNTFYSMQIDYSQTAGTILLAWEETVAHSGPTTIRIDGGDLATTVPALQAPGVNLAVLTNVSPSSFSDPNYQIEVVSADETYDAQTQSVIKGLPMGDVSIQSCTESTATGTCSLVIDWFNPGPPASGYEVSFAGDFQGITLTPGQELGNLSGIVATPVQGDYFVTITSFILFDDPNLFEDFIEGIVLSGSFRGAPVTVQNPCSVSCGGPIPDPPLGVALRQSAYSAGDSNDFIASWGLSAESCAENISISVDGQAATSVPATESEFLITGLSSGTHEVELQVDCAEGLSSNPVTKSFDALSASPHTNVVIGDVICGWSSIGGGTAELSWTPADDSDTIDLYVDASPAPIFRETIAWWPPGREVPLPDPSDELILQFMSSATDGVRYGSPLIPSVQLTRYIPGACNGVDATVSLASVNFGLNYLFKKGPAPPCLKACDPNGDTLVDIADMIYLLIFHFLGGEAPTDWVDLSGDPAADPTCLSAGVDENCDTSNASCQ